MLELKSNTDEGRQCKHCGYKRISSDKGNRKNCPSCHTAYDTRKSKRQGSGNSSLFNSCVAESQNKKSVQGKRGSSSKTIKRTYQKNSSITAGLTAGGIVVWLSISVTGVFCAIALKAYMGF